ncbi:MAG: 3-dehydroquinate dehydratase [Bacteroidetes bacterium]|nr:3-dehydroquinate dehydratase [Bacteroidota bacterium]
MKKTGIINGPNLNLTGKREPEIYGKNSFDELLIELKSRFELQTEIFYFQTNIEGELINKIQEWGFYFDGIVLNAGAYSHTSIAIADAVKSIKSPVIGVHLSNIYNRENERHTDLLLGACKGNISGLGFAGYKLAIEYIISL